MSEANKDFVHHWLEEVWDKGNLAAIDDFVAPEYVLHDEPTHSLIRGPEGIRQLISSVRSGLPDINVTAEDILADGDKVAYRWSARSTHRGELMGIPPTGKQVTMTGTDIYRIQDGKIVEAWSSRDALGLLQQLDAVTLTSHGD